MLSEEEFREVSNLRIEINDLLHKEITVDEMIVIKSAYELLGLSLEEFAGIVNAIGLMPFHRQRSYYERAVKDLKIYKKQTLSGNIENYKKHLFNREQSLELEMKELKLCKARVEYLQKDKTRFVERIAELEKELKQCQNGKY